MIRKLWTGVETRFSEFASLMRGSAHEQRAAVAAFVRAWTDVPRLWGLSRRAYARRKNAFFVGFLATIVLIVVLGVIQAFLPKEIVSHVFSVNDVDYDYRLPKSPEFALHRFSDAGQGANHDFSIAFDVKPADDGKSSDVFQTATLNDGIRLEYSPPGTLAMVVGSDAPPGYKVFIASGAGAGQWHRFRASISHDGHVQMAVDGLEQVDSNETGLNYSVNDVIVGEGFNESRVFTGAIHDATLQIRSIEPSPVAGSPMWRVLMALLFLYNIYFLLLMGDRVREDVVRMESALNGEAQSP